MNHQPTMEERIWDYIDGLSSPDEKNFIEELLASNLEWKTKYGELLEVHQMMQQHIDLEEPSMRFTQNVMEEIAKYQIAPATKSYINKNIVRGILVFFVTMVVALIAYGFSQVDWSSGNPGSGLPLDISRVDFSKVVNNNYTNAFVMINVVLGLILLDMYLGKRKKEAIS